ncbi:transcriptional regulator domain-containing protein [Sphingomonas bisphenolicum]
MVAPALLGRLHVLARCGRAGLAWEVLRRNPAYRTAVQALAGTKCSGKAASQDFTTTWGLHFR